MTLSIILAFCLLGVAVLGLTFVVARGGGDAMAEPVRPTGALVLPDEPLRAEDLAKVGFSVVVRGYRMDEVDAVIDRLQRELAAREEPAQPSTDASNDSAEPSTTQATEASGDPVMGQDPVHPKLADPAATTAVLPES